MWAQIGEGGEGGEGARDMGRKSVEVARSNKQNVEYATCLHQRNVDSLDWHMEGTSCF